MINLDQVRAHNALAACPSLDRKAVTRLPALIHNNGLLAAAAFAKDKGKDLCEAMKAIISHLADVRINKVKPGTNTIDGLFEDLADPAETSNSRRLRMATQEALAYLTYLKRFAEEKKE